MLRATTMDEQNAVGKTVSGFSRAVSTNFGTRESDEMRAQPTTAFRKPMPKMTLRYDKTLMFQDAEQMGKWRIFCRDAILTQNFEMGVGFVILANFVTIAIETDAWAQLSRSEEGTTVHANASSRLDLINIINLLFLGFYVMESALRLYVCQGTFFNYKWNVFDLTIVVLGIVGEIMSRIVIEEGDSSVANMQVLRTLRMIRLFRASRIVISFHELYSLVCGLANCMRTLLWAAGLILLLLTMFSIIAVEYIQPYLPALDEAGYYTTCYWCPHAFDNIMHANLSWFLIMSGDGWSVLARPIIEHHPWTAIIFVLLIFIMMFGLLNLITAVIVDTAVQGRESDLINLSHKKEEEREQAWSCFTGLCQDLDKDKSGDIDIDELREGIKEKSELRAHLSVMGVEEDDLQMVFSILDPDDDGVVTHHEFATQLYKMKTQSVQTSVQFVKHYVHMISTQLREVRYALRDCGVMRSSQFSSASRDVNSSWAKGGPLIPSKRATEAHEIRTSEASTQRHTFEEDEPNQRASGRSAFKDTSSMEANAGNKKGPRFDNGENDSACSPKSPGNDLGGDGQKKREADAWDLPPPPLEAPSTDTVSIVNQSDVQRATRPHGRYSSRERSRDNVSGSGKERRSDAEWNSVVGEPVASPFGAAGSLAPEEKGGKSGKSGKGGKSGTRRCRISTESEDIAPQAYIE